MPRRYDGPFPTANEIAQAVIEASRHFGENPDEIANPASAMRSRWIAFDALREAYPDADRKRLAHCLCISTDAQIRSYSAVLSNYRRAPWWSDRLVDEIVGALVAEHYGEQAQ
jgi:hypothetical protein